MQSFASLCKRICPALAALTLALLLALPLPAGAQAALDEGAFISIRYYDGIDPMDMTEIERITRDGFVPIISGSEGFLGYYVVYSAEDVMVAINLFESREQSIASNQQASEFVVDSLAPLLPNPPRIVEGSVDIGFVELLHGMGDGDVSGLHASVRIYDGFHAEDLDEFVATVEDGFLPIMRGTDGFFGYYLMHADAAALTAISIFDSEESALASNESASEFVAENLTAYLPEDPLIASGRVGIAVLADLNEGANLIDGMTMDEPVFASLRVYTGVDPADQVEIARLTAEGFLPIMRESAGFVGYYLLPAGDELVALSLFHSAEQAAASTAKAREFVAANLAPLLPESPQIYEGPLGLHDVAGAHSPRFASIRIYQGVDMARIDEANALAARHLLPSLRALDGFFAQHTLHQADGTTVGVSVTESQAAAMAANEIGKSFSAEHLMDVVPGPPASLDTTVAIAALAEIHMGENLRGTAQADERAFVSIRVYDGISPEDLDAIVHHSATGYLPIINTRDDFIAYFQLPSGDTAAAVSIFATAEGASASNAAAAGYVAEHMAPLLPNPPHIFEGTIDLFYMALLDEMMTLDASDVSSLHGALRIYDKVDLSERGADVELVETLFLPIQQQAGGFFGYVNMNNGESGSAALSIFDSEENALAANAAAADFVAEHFSDSHPENPLRVNGQLGVAALADVNAGANLVDEMMAEDVFVSVRVYDGIDPADHDEIVRLVDPEFLSIMQASEGFVGYYLMPAGDQLVAISLFDSAEQASASNQKARDYVEEFMAPLLPNAPMTVEGTIDVSTQLMAKLGDAMTPEDMAQPLYGALRIYRDFDMIHLEASNRLVESILLPAQIEAGGLFAYFSINDGVDTIAGFSVFDSREGAATVGAIAADFVAEHLADVLPEDPVSVSGRLGVAARDGVLAGVNAATWETME